MTRARSLQLLVAALAGGALAAGVGHVAGADLCYLPTIGLGAFLVVLTLGMVAMLPHDEPRPIARLTPQPSVRRETTPLRASSPD